MQIGLAFRLAGLAMGCLLLAGCQTISQPAGAGQVQLKLSDPSPTESDLANALANYSMGLLREGMADQGALANYIQAIQLQPAQLDLYVRAAALCLQNGEPSSAVALMQAAGRHNPDQPDALVYLAQIYLALQQWDLAEAACRQAMPMDPSNFKPYLQLTLIFYEQGQAERGLALLQEALPKLKDKRPALRLLGDLYIQRARGILSGQISPDLQKAIDYYQLASCEPLDKLSISYLRQLGDLYLLTRQFESAIACFLGVMAQDTRDIQIQKKMALCYLAIGNKEEALTLLKRCADQEPNNAEIQYYLGELYENMADPTNAIAHFALACQARPASSKPFLKLALLYCQTDPHQATQVLESGLKQIPADQKILEMLALLYLNNHQTNAAKANLEQLQNIAIQQHDSAQAASLLLYYGAIAQQYQLWENAESIYRQALELQPALLDASIRLAFLYLDQGRQDLARPIMAKVAETLADDFASLYFLGLFYNRLGSYQQAKESFEQAWDAAALEPGASPELDPDFYFNYAIACERSGQFNTAEALLQYILRQAPDNAEAFNYLAYMWADRGINLEQALEYINHALDLDPENGAFIDTLGWIYFRLGRCSEALLEIKNALFFMPEDPTIMEHLGDILEALNYHQEALLWWQRAYQKDPQTNALADKLHQRGINLKKLRQTPAQP